MQERAKYNDDELQTQISRVWGFTPTSSRLGSVIARLIVIKIMSPNSCEVGCKYSKITCDVLDRQVIITAVLAVMAGKVAGPLHCQNGFLLARIY